MKKSIFYLIALYAVSLVISGYYTGVGTTFGLDCTGAETALGNTSGCSITGACHVHALHEAWISVELELDSAGIPTTHYTGGVLYTVKLKGINNSTDSLPAFGFQITSIAGDTAAPVPTNAGTWTMPFPANTHYSPPQPSSFNLGLMEQNPPLPVTTGNGTLGSTYEVVFNWTAPPTGTGDVSFWGVVNAINNDGTYAGDNYNNNHLVINEWSATTTGINSLNKHPGFELYPNPAVDQLTISYVLEKTAVVSIQILDLSGKELMKLQDEKVNAGQQQLDAAISNLNKGIYIVDLFVEGKHNTKKLVVQ